MRRAPRSLRDVEPRHARLLALGALARSARAAGVSRWRALVAAGALVSLVLSSPGRVDSASQTTTVLGPRTIVAAVTDTDRPVALDADNRVPTPGSIAQAADDPDGLIHLQLVPGDSELRYIISLRTLLQPLQASACATRNVTGELVLTTDGALDSDLSTIVADMRTMHCAPPLRDGNAQALLETDKYPTASATFEQAPGLTVPLPTGDATSPLIGQQTLHGVTRHAEYATSATFGNGDVTGHATTPEKMTSFNIMPPRIGPLLEVEDDMTIEFNFHAAISGGPANGVQGRLQRRTLTESADGG